MPYKRTIKTANIMPEWLKRVLHISGDPQSRRKPAAEKRPHPMPNHVHVWRTGRHI